MTASRWRLDGQLALVTGASAGIGLASARELLALGGDVLLVARQADALEAARDELTDQFPERMIEGFAADVADDDERRALLDWVEDQGDGLHILVNTVGASQRGEAMEFDEDAWRAVFETSLFSAFELCRYAQPLLARHPASSIVNVGAASGLRAVRGETVDGMAKARCTSSPAAWRSNGRSTASGSTPWRRGRSAPRAPRPHWPTPTTTNRCWRGPRCSASAQRKKSPASSPSCVCRRPATSPANASRWTAASAGSASEPASAVCLRLYRPSADPWRHARRRWLPIACVSPCRRD